MTILIAALPLSIGVTAASITTGNADGKTFVLGDVLYYEDFEDETLDTVPTGWEVS